MPLYQITDIGPDDAFAMDTHLLVGKCFFARQPPQQWPNGPWSHGDVNLLIHPEVNAADWSNTPFHQITFRTLPL